MGDLAAVAAELYRMTAGHELSPGERSALGAILTEQDGARWTNRNYRIAGPAQKILAARALAGLLLLDEDVVWVAADRRSHSNAWQLMRTLVTSGAVPADQVRSVRATNGDERIDMATGARLRFMTEANGVSADCYLLDGSLLVPWPVAATRANVQVVQAGAR